jgi:hypothetical protein
MLHAQQIDDPLSVAIERRAAGALTLLGLAAVPSETASTLFLDTGQEGSSGIDFTAAQLGGGFTWSDDFPLYLEGYVGWNRYDPVFVFSDGTEQRATEAKWNSFALSGAVGWDFDLGENTVLRPMGLLALGAVASDVTLGGLFLGDRLGKDVDFLKDGSLTAGGYGGALALAYNERWENDWEVDVTLRHTRLYLEPIGGDKDVVGSAQSFTTGLWSRLRVPTGYKAFDRPVRGVGEFAVGYYGGDQREIFNTPWLAQVGLGGSSMFPRQEFPGSRLRAQCFGTQKVKALRVSHSGLPSASDEETLQAQMVSACSLIACFWNFGQLHLRFR